MTNKLCSFCGKDADECLILIEGSHANICGICVDGCKILVDKNFQDLLTKRRVKLSELLTERDHMWLATTDAPYHALLTSGKHSDGFVNMSNALTDHDIIESVFASSADLVEFCDENNVTVLCGQAMGSIGFAAILAQSLQAHVAVRPIFTEKDGDLMSLNRFDVKDQNVLLIEDVTTTGSTSLKSLKAIESKGGTVVGIYTAVNRSGKITIEFSGPGPLRELRSIPILSALDVEIKTFEASDCPLCANGSEAIKPKANWDLLTQKQSDV